MVFVDVVQHVGSDDHAAVDVDRRRRRVVRSITAVLVRHDPAVGVADWQSFRFVLARLSDTFELRQCRFDLLLTARDVAQLFSHHVSLPLRSKTLVFRLIGGLRLSFQLVELGGESLLQFPKFIRRPRAASAIVGPHPSPIVRKRRQRQVTHLTSDQPDLHE